MISILPLVEGYSQLHGFSFFWVSSLRFGKTHTHTHKAGLFKTQVSESKCVCTWWLKTQACCKHVTTVNEGTQAAWCWGRQWSLYVSIKHQHADLLHHEKTLIMLMYNEIMWKFVLRLKMYLSHLFSMLHYTLVTSTFLLAYLFQGWEFEKKDIDYLSYDYRDQSTWRQGQSGTLLTITSAGKKRNGSPYSQTKITTAI